MLDAITKSLSEGHDDLRSTRDDVAFLKRFAIEAFAFVLHIERRRIDIQKPLRWIDQGPERRAEFRRLALEYLEEPIADEAGKAKL